MKLFQGSIRKKLAMLVIFATLPVFLIHLGTELMNRHDALHLAEKETSIYLSGFAEIQNRITASTQTLLRTVASIPDVSKLDVEKSRIILATLLEANPIYTNVILVDLKGDVVAAGRNHDSTKTLNFSDRKQFKDAILFQRFSSGEVVVGKSTQKGIFPFGMPVKNDHGELVGVIIIGVSLSHYAEYFERGDYPLNSFFGICDHNGIRLFRYPNDDDSEFGKPIKKDVFEAASAAGKKGRLRALTSDAKKSIIAFESLRLNETDSPYMYLFLGVDYAQLEQQANSILNRLLFTSLLSLVVALFIAWNIGGKSVTRLIEQLSRVARKFSQGEKNVVSHIDYSDGEIGELAQSFDTMVKMIHEREEEQAKLQSQLNHSQKMDAVGQLAGGIAHDFNNMLGGIMGAAEVLARYLPDDGVARKFHGHIMQSATRAADLTSKLLTFSRNSRMSFSTVDIHNIVNETIEILNNTIDRRIKIETDLQATSSLVLGDPSQLQSALLNLAINASHAMPEGGTLSISSCMVELDDLFCKTSTFNLQPGQYLGLDIKDTGCGIPVEHRDKIFEPFFTTKELNKGTGLGLAVVYGTIKQHAGSIMVYSESDIGTTFKILLPLASESTVDQATHQVLMKGEGTILLVDDEEVMRITASEILQNLGYTVIMAENGEEALNVFKANRGLIDLVILDMVMPVMNGRDCFMALKQQDHQVRVLLSSGFTREEDLEKMKEQGLKGFIHKPYLSSSLSQSVYEALR
jgi:signal transduction histidine kinase